MCYFNRYVFKLFGMSSKVKLSDLTGNVKLLPFSSPISGSSKTSKQQEDGDKIKTKLLEAWNNWKFEFSEGTDLSNNSPLWLLGRCYEQEKADEPANEQESDNDKEKRALSKMPTHIRRFVEDFYSKPWFTYRKGFPPFQNSSLTSDTGWGCMIRTSQMMLCQGLFMHFLKRDWRWSSVRPESLKVKDTHRKVIQWFVDEPNPRCPFSIHQLTEIGLNYKYKPGDWYGPSTMAYILQDAVECGKGTNSELNRIVVYVAQDCAVYSNDVREMCRWDRPLLDEIEKRSVIILIPIRLGESTINPVYIPCLQNLFKIDGFIGIVGGKPRHSLYFVGVQDSYLIYLDPHYSQPSNSLQSFSNKNLQAYHSSSPRKTHISKMDPSCCLGFYCRDEEQFRFFVEQASNGISPLQKTNFPLYLVADGSVKDHKYNAAHRVEVLTSNSNSEISIETEESDFALLSQQTASENEVFNSNFQNNVTVGSSSTSVSPKSDKGGFSFAKPREFIANFYRQQSKSPRSKRKNIPLEEEFEIL